jgi:F0F1-type ATP synthase assembly protein I
MFRVVFFQFVTTAIVAAVAAAVAGEHAALSALAGGLACTLPNGLFALHLALPIRKPAPEGDGARAAASAALRLLVGEFLKVVLTAALLALVLLGYRQLVWPALMLSVCAVLIVQPVALALRR